MPGRLLFLIFLTSSLGLAAQEITVAPRVQTVFDSLHELSSRQWLQDSLSVLAWGDSVRSGVNGKATSTITALNQKIDSLSRLQLPTGKLQGKIDSINRKKDQLLGEVDNKQEELLGGTKKKLNDWQARIRSKLGLKMNDINSATTDLGGKPVGDLNLPTNNLNLPGNALQDVNLPLKDLNLTAEDLKIPGLEAVDFQNLDLPTDLSGISQSLPFSSIDGLQEWQGKITDITGQVPSLEGIKSNPDKILETAATNIAPINDAQKVLNTNALEQGEYGALIKNVNDEEAMKKVIANEVKKEALNHFAGKEQVLQSAMEQVAKYKKAYSSVNSLSEIRNLPKNSMKGKPFRERFLPGFALQVHTRSYLNFDFNPYAAYRITEKISAGLGWNQRWALDWGNKSWVPDARIFGPRAFGELKLKRGFAIRLEGEAMNTSVPPYYLAPGETRREWSFTTMTGLKKEYRFIKNVKGFTIVQFDLIKLFVPNHRSAYGDVVNARLGFEFPMKKKPIRKVQLKPAIP